MMAKLTEQAAAKAVDRGHIHRRSFGIGPEISVSALQHEEVYRICRPFLIGDLAVFAAVGLKGGTSTRPSGLPTCSSVLAPLIS